MSPSPRWPRARRGPWCHDHDPGPRQLPEARRLSASAPPTSPLAPGLVADIGQQHFLCGRRRFSSLAVKPADQPNHESDHNERDHSVEELAQQIATSVAGSPACAAWSTILSSKVHAAECNPIGGMMMSSTSDVTTVPSAAPMITPIASAARSSSAGTLETPRHGHSRALVRRADATLGTPARDPDRKT